MIEKTEQRAMSGLIKKPVVGVSYFMRVIPV